MQLMLKNEPVLLFIKNAEGLKLKKVINPEMIPIPLKRELNDDTFSEWLKGRSIPEDRVGFKEVKKLYGEKCFLSRNYASLTDQYWIQNREEKWSKINFFTRKYDKTIGKALFSPWEVECIRSQDSPDLTTSGLLRKRWKQDDDTLKSKLIKAGSKAAGQEPLYEVLAAILCERMGIKIADYELCVEGFRMCVGCLNFIDESTELVTAKDVYYTEERPDDVSVDTHLLRMCDKFKIPGADRHINDITVIDILTGNTDRNLSNIGFIRNTDTLEFTGPAPIFDCGNAYGCVNSEEKADTLNDPQKDLLKEYGKSVDLEAILKDNSLKDMIMDYPCLNTDEKKKLIKNMEERNNMVLSAIR